MDVADWFSGFCAIHGSSDCLPEEEQQAAVVKPKKRRGRPSKKVLQRVSTQLNVRSVSANWHSELGLDMPSRYLASAGIPVNYYLICTQLWICGTPFCIIASHFMVPSEDLIPAGMGFDIVLTV